MRGRIGGARHSRRGVKHLKLPGGAQWSSQFGGISRRPIDGSTMLGGKKDDLAALARFLDHEAERWEKIRPARDAIARIRSLAQAEAEARSALEAAQADLAWAKIQAARLQTLLPQAKEA